jgi:hypothetical protein
VKAVAHAPAVAHRWAKVVVPVRVVVRPAKAVDLAPERVAARALGAVVRRRAEVVLVVENPVVLVASRSFGQHARLTGPRRPLESVSR